jgi:hypothetical protein
MWYIKLSQNQKARWADISDLWGLEQSHANETARDKRIKQS